MTDTTIFATLESAGITRQRLDEVLGRDENWGSLVHAFEYLSVCSAVLSAWPEEGSTS